MWNERYSVAEYVYGTDPNSFLEEHSYMLLNPVLSIAEGEGRNAVFLASLGFDVLGIDSSEAGVKKSHKLASSRGIKIQTQIADLGNYIPPENHFGSVISIFAHLPGKIRSRLCPLIEKCLKPGGIIILEAYSESQIIRETGGPKDPDLLLTVSKVEQEFPNIEPIHLKETEREVSEGIYHTGLASVVQFKGKKIIN